MRLPSLILSFVACCVFGGSSMLAFTPLGSSGGREERYLLYTEPDKTCTGGIQGRIIGPAQPLEQILAVWTTNQQKVYEGKITGEKRDTFEFQGLPMGKYDLVAIFRENIYEGLLCPGSANTLTRDDQEKINTAIQKSEAYFPIKTIHRMGGETGRGNPAGAFATYYRNLRSELMASHQGQAFRNDHRLTFKWIILKDVGVGWQIVKSRDLYPVWIVAGSSLPKHAYKEQLSQIRVADKIKNLGDIDLTR